MERTNIFQKLDIAFSEKAGREYTAAQMLRLYLRARRLEKSLILPAGQKDEELKKFSDFLENNKDAFLGAKPGLKDDWFSGDSLFSADGKKLYFFIFTDCASPLLVKGVMNKKKELYHLVSKKPVELDKSLGLGEGPGSLWIKPSEKDENTGCAVLCLSCNEPIKLYSGTGAPITQN